MLNSVKIMGQVYNIQYMDKPSDVDVLQRRSLWGQIDFWTKTIRIYKKNCCIKDIYEVLMHEVLHGFAHRLKIDILDIYDNKGNEDRKKHDELDLLSMAIIEFIWDNELIKDDIKNEKVS
jgi:hypothetical protein